MASPQAREMVFKMIAQQVAQAPPERQGALSRVTVTLERTGRDMHLQVGYSDDPQIEEIINGIILRPGRAHNAESAAAKRAAAQVEGTLTPVTAEIERDIGPLSSAHLSKQGLCLQHPRSRGLEVIIVRQRLTHKFC